jgi:hypothetical protein
MYKYSLTLSVSSDTYGTRQIANTNYGVCVRMAAGYCSILWQQNPSDIYSFTLTGDTDGIDPTLLGKCSSQVTGKVFARLSLS